MADPEAPSDDPAAPTFDELPLSADVRQAVDDLGYVNPTPVQRAVFEPATRGKDLVVQARTGTGKTAAFGLPLVDTIVKKGSAAVQAMVLCPTRELALQVCREIEALAKHRGVKTVAVYGGAPMPGQIQQINEGAQLLVGTPGRVLDHIGRKTLDPSTIRALVLDECDEMLSMGFLPQINDILERLPDNRQTLLFSATVPRDVVRIAETKLHDPEFITLSGDHIGALEIEHYVYVSRGDKLNEFVQILEVENPEGAIVFCNTRDQTKKVARHLADRGFDADWLNADLSQAEREKVMRRTREGRLRFLVATDVAARGIDISHLTHVLNYDFPESAEQYVHRTGRTGRAGKIGTAISLVLPSDVGNLYMLRLTYKIRPIEKSLPSARELKTRAETDIVQMLVAGYGALQYHPDDIALARRLLSHEHVEAVVAGIIRDHLGKSDDAQKEATARRRATPKPKPPQPSGQASAGTPSSSRSESPREGSRKKRGRGASQERRKEPAEGDSRSSGARRGPRGDAKAQRSDARRAERPPKERDDEGTDEQGDIDPMDLAEVFVNVGRKDGAKAADFREALEARGGVARADTGFVRIRHRHSFVGVRRDLLDQAVTALDGATIAGKEASAEPARRV